MRVMPHRCASDAMKNFDTTQQKQHNTAYILQFSAWNPCVDASSKCPQLAELCDVASLEPVEMYPL